MDLLFANPVITVRHVQNHLKMSQPGAANLLRLLTGYGILKETGSGPGTRHRWFCEGVLEVLDPEQGSVRQL